MGKGWTEERRTRQAELIRNWKPWERATGPKSEEGKQRSARNAYKGGEWVVLRQAIIQLNMRLQMQRGVIKMPL